METWGEACEPKILFMGWYVHPSSLFLHIPGADTLGQATDGPRKPQPPCWSPALTLAPPALASRHPAQCPRRWLPVLALPSRPYFSPGVSLQGPLSCLKPAQLSGLSLRSLPEGSPLHLQTSQVPLAWALCPSPAHTARPMVAVTTARWEPGGHQVCGNRSFVTGLLTSWSPEIQGREVGHVQMVNLVTYRPCEQFG